MKKPFVVIFDTIDNENEMSDFEEVIRSNYVSKKGKENVFIIAADENEKSKNIHNFIMERCSFSPSLLVIKMEFFYGMFNSNDFIPWFREHFSHMNLTE